MDNIFEKAKFGDKFLLRDGRIVTFYSQKWKGDYYFCIVDPQKRRMNTENMLVQVFRPNGTEYWGFEERDIVSRYQEPIDEEKLDELAEDSADDYVDDICDKNKNFIVEDTYIEGFKVGYRKAMEK